MKQSRLLKSLIIISLPLLLLACDPIQTLMVSNQTDSDIALTFIFKKDKITERFSEFVASDTLIIELDTTAANSTKRYYFEMGTWETLHAIDSLAAMIEMIEIKTTKTKTIFSNEKEINTFLKNKLKEKSNIEIIIK